MKEISLIFPGLGYKNINQALVYIYDKNNNLILNSKTYNGKITVCLKIEEIYKIKAINNNEEQLGVVYVKSKNNYIIPFSNSFVCNNTITFLLTDYNYTNLPIERGSIIVWQKQ